MRRLHGGVLGIATGAYLPYCFFNLISPVISLVYGFTGLRIEHIKPPSKGRRRGTQRPREGPAMEGGTA